MTFPEALELVRQGKFIARDSWSGGDFLFGMPPQVKAQFPVLANKFPEGINVHPYIMHKQHDVAVPWTPNTTELMAEDWNEVL